MLKLLKTKTYFNLVKNQRLAYNQGFFGGYGASQKCSFTYAFYGGFLFLVTILIVEFLQDTLVKCFSRFNLLKVAPPQAP